MTTNTDKSRVTSMAIAIFNANPSLTWSDCMKRAWDFHWFRQMLVNGIVHFYYLKANDYSATGNIPFVFREARGTLLMDVIPENKRPKGTATYKPNYKNMAYYDLDREDWRSFDVTRFDRIVRFIPK